MSLVDSLKKTLLRQECHYAWSLGVDDFDLHDVASSLEEQILLNSGKAKVARAYNSLAFVNYLYDDFNAALTNLQKSEELAKAHHGEESDTFLMVTYGNLAWLYYHMENFDLCGDYLKQLERISQKFSNRSSNEVHCEVLKEKGWAFLTFSSKYYNGATECFRRALEINPKDSDLNAGYAIALYHTTFHLQDLQDSQTIKQLRLAIDLNPDNAVLLTLLALTLLNNVLFTDHSFHKHESFQFFRFHEILSLVIRAIEASPENPHVMRYVAQISRKMKHADFVISQLEKMLRSSPNSAFMHHQLALFYKLKRMFLWSQSLRSLEPQRKCLYHLKQAVSLKPSFIVALAELGLQYGQIQNIPEAEKLFHQAFQTAHEKKKDLQIVHALYGQFQLYIKGSEKLAVQHYMEGLSLQPGRQESQNCETELKMIVQFRFSKNPGDSKACAIKGFIHEIRGDKLKAIECYQKALTNQKLGKGKEAPLVTVLRIWVLGFQGAEKSATNLISGGHTQEVHAVHYGEPKILKGTMFKKMVRMVEADLCSAKKTLMRDKSVLTPGPHAIVLAFFLRNEQFTLDTKKMLEDLEIFGESVWKHVIVLFTEGDKPIGKYTGSQDSVLQWLLEKCENRHYITGIGSQVNQSIEFSERIMKMISRNNTMHLVIPDTSSKKSSCLKMGEETESEKGDLVTPEIITENKLSMYRFKCSRAGWFQCTFTQLGFRMMGEGELLYMTVEQDSTCPVSTNHYAAGPLYDIKCVQGELSELQFPHCEESPENCNFMTVAHYTGDNVEVLEPQSVSRTHVRVKVPGSSRFHLRDMLNWFKIRITGHVIIIYLPHPQHRLLIYLQPSNVDPHLIRDRVDGGRLILGTCKCTLEHGSKYNLVCSPLTDSEQTWSGTMKEKLTDFSTPKGVLFRRERTYYYHDFEVQLPREMTKIMLKLNLCRTGEQVWKYELTRLEDYERKSTSNDKRDSVFLTMAYDSSYLTAHVSSAEKVSKPSMTFLVITAASYTGERFIENNWADLVQKVSLVEPFADDLLPFIGKEKYSQIIAAETSQDKMRKLYSFLVTQTLKEKFYQSLLKHEGHLVEDLTNTFGH